jgi:addiction module RelB/DinJ family antitoxin
MSRIIRSAMVQVRVTPGVKWASEQVFWRIGLNMTEAMELFLRRVIVDQKLPFEVVALDETTMAQIGYDGPSIHGSTRSRRVAGARRPKGG